MQGSLNATNIEGSNKQQMYCNFDGFPIEKCIVWVGNTPQSST